MNKESINKNSNKMRVLLGLIFIICVIGRVEKNSAKNSSTDSRNETQAVVYQPQDESNSLSNEIIALYYKLDNSSEHYCVALGDALSTEYHRYEQAHPNFKEIALENLSRYYENISEKARQLGCIQ